MSQLVKRLGGLFGDGMSGGYLYSEVISNGATSNPIYIPSLGRGTTNGTVALICGSNTGKVQITLDSDTLIDADSAVWVDWENGEVTGTSIDVFVGSITAIRGVSVSGEITLKIVI